MMIRTMMQANQSCYGYAYDMRYTATMVQTAATGQSYCTNNCRQQFLLKGWWVLGDNDGYRLRCTLLVYL